MIYQIDGHTKGLKQGRRPSVSTEALNTVKADYDRNPKCSTRQAARELQISHMTVHKTLKKLKCYPQKIK